MKKILNIIKCTGNFFSAIGYYFSTIMFSLIIAIAIISILFISSYNEITTEYAQVQIAWHNLDNDIATDLKETKNQIKKLMELNTTDNPYYTETSRNLRMILNMTQDIDNAMSYQQKIAIYKEIETVIKDTEKMTKYIDINNEYPFDSEKLLSNNIQLKEAYNQKCKSINNKIKSNKYKIIVNAFSLHSWSVLP